MCGMARLKSELTVECPCCHATLVVDTNLKRVVSHVEPERGDKPNLDDAQGILRAETARREALFEDSVHNERTRGDALVEALRRGAAPGAGRADHPPEARLRLGLSLLAARAPSGARAGRAHGVPVTRPAR